MKLNFFKVKQGTLRWKQVEVKENGQTYFRVVKRPIMMVREKNIYESKQNNIMVH